VAHQLDSLAAKTLAMCEVSEVLELRTPWAAGVPASMRNWLANLGAFVARARHARMTHQL
jgi:hypothetical protein